MGTGLVIVRFLLGRPAGFISGVDGFEARSGLILIADPAPNPIFTTAR
jgi:hypothetical protein